MHREIEIWQRDLRLPDEGKGQNKKLRTAGLEIAPSWLKNVEILPSPHVLTHIFLEKE